MVGTLKFLTWGKPWILITPGGKEIDLRPIFQKFFLDAKNRRLDAQTGQERLTLKVKKDANLILDFEGMERDRLSAKNVQSGIFLDLGILLETILINLDGRQVIFEIEPYIIRLGADPAQEIHRVSLSSSCDTLSERAIEEHCRPEVGKDACIFFNPKRKGCEKFSNQASRRLTALTHEETNGPRRIGNCGQEIKAEVKSRPPGW